jgi:hypothetical protein
VANDLPAGNQVIPHWFHENIFGRVNDSYAEFLRWLSFMSRRIKGERSPRLVPRTHHVHESVFDRIEGRQSFYVTAPAEPEAMRLGYTPVAQVDDGAWHHGRTAFKGRLAETADYLPKEAMDFQLERLGRK